ncbi:hypothetical protein M427DRAFT_58468 [Gonapodya prolifera JEL478]|uniref:Uncharacterized protein n=1 Tax=Gonapodya prolifera (strain JEL478) TaxID=1344416 RepID=A0A139AB83_GONPJ|nr:hypothetical protein M427DRAFT_58468 [Gonapodya prolifera JEL478]|eukprot:KXS13653.1 hypothetical protein M427DRAFT_58468 [Gonapodya prolifera JEL478]
MAPGSKFVSGRDDGPADEGRKKKRDRSRGADSRDGDGDGDGNGNGDAGEGNARKRRREDNPRGQKEELRTPSNASKSTTEKNQQRQPVADRPEKRPRHGADGDSRAIEAIPFGEVVLAPPILPSLRKLKKAANTNSRKTLAESLLTSASSVLPAKNRNTAAHARVEQARAEAVEAYRLLRKKKEEMRGAGGQG